MTQPLLPPPPTVTQQIVVIRVKITHLAIIFWSLKMKRRERNAVTCI